MMKLSDFMFLGIVAEGLSEGQTRRSGEGMGMAIIFTPYPWEILGALLSSAALTMYTIRPYIDPFIGFIFIILFGLLGAWLYVRLHKWSLRVPPLPLALVLLSGVLWATATSFALPGSMSPVAAWVIIVLVFVVASALKFLNMACMPAVK